MRCTMVCRMRQIKGFLYRWRYFIITIFIVYGLFLYIPMAQHEHRQSENMEIFHKSVERLELAKAKRVKEAETPMENEPAMESNDQVDVGEQIEPVEEKKGKEAAGKKPGANAPPKGDHILFSPTNEEPFFVENVLTNFGLSLEEKFTCNVDKTAPPKILLSLNAGHGQENLGGCPDWNCKLVHDRSKVDVADAVMIMYHEPSYKHANPDQYSIFFSQESPKNTGMYNPGKGYFNMSLGFRHDSPTASPYGYTVKLAPPSYRKGELINRALVEGKSKGAAWFVSHCNTNSLREQIVVRLKETFEVDIYGACGNMKCAKGGECEKSLDTDYHFYVAYENSICKDYITEKLWNQGYKRDVVPLVLKRSLVEPFVPPNSFIAVDDFKTVEEMSDHLHYLMQNKTAYMEYFEWRRQYRVIFLDGNNHDVYERPWGFCQICRLMWDKTHKKYTIDDFDQYWTNTCEIDGTLAGPYINNRGSARKNGTVSAANKGGAGVRRIPKKNPNF